MFRKRNIPTSIILLAVLLCCSVLAMSQQKKITGKQGIWTITPYTANCVKLAYTPDQKKTGYATNENVSDAVILKPQSKSMIPVISTSEGLQIGRTKKITILEPVHDGDYYSIGMYLSAGEKIFGGGERALPLDRRGYRFNLYNNPWSGSSDGADNLNYSVPFFTSSKGYGLFFDNASKGYADIGKTHTDEFSVGFKSGELNVYVIFGDTYQQILHTYHQLTGTQPVPPRWAFGNFMSRFGYSSQQQVMDIARQMKEKSMPVDAIIFDLFWFGDSIKQTMGNLNWMNHQKWPDPADMIAGFKKDKINTILITEPFVLQASANYEASRQYHATNEKGQPFLLTDFYFGHGGLIDIFRKDARDWFLQKYKKQMDIGVEAWWGDLGEPEKHPDGIFHNLKEKGFSRLFRADEVHNIYGHTWTKMLYDFYAKDYPEKRLFSLNRSGFAGSQRFGIFPWSGDVSRSWNGLKAQLPIMLSMSMSGVPYIHADAGGFAGGEGDLELYQRWLQFAVYTPIFRPHGTALFDIDKNAYSFPSEAAMIDDASTQDIARKAIYTRYALLPYNYTLAYQQAKSGSPLVAPLYYASLKDTSVANVSDEFLWGDALLVAPVLEKGITQRGVVFPQGNWYAFNALDQQHASDIIFSGKSTITLSKDQIPVFVKAGSFIPTQLNTRLNRNTGYYSSDSMYVDYYYSKHPSMYELFEDDGQSKSSLTKGRFELIRFAAQTGTPKTEITIRSNGGRFNGKPASRCFMMRLHGFGAGLKIILMNGKPVKQFVINRDVISIPVNFTGNPIAITIQ